MSGENNLVAMAIEVVASYISHNNMRPDDLPGFIAQTHAAIAALSATPEPDAAETEATPEHQPAVTVRKSLASREYILSMIDGKPYKALKRHIARHGMTPAEYRERYGLKADYPMTAPAYSEHRREVAKTLGLGRKPGSGAKSTGADTKAAATSANGAEAKAAEPKPKRGAKAKSDGQDAPQPAKRRGRPPKATPTEMPKDGTPIGT